MGENNLVFRQMFDYDTWTYTYLLYNSKSKEGILIDTVKEHVERDIKQINELGIKLKYNLETHVHADHITGADDIRQRTKAEVVYGAGSKVPCADINAKDGQELTFGDFTIKVLSTPGHTNGCTSYYIEGMVFTGDAMLIRGCGRTDFQDGSADTLYESVNQKLFTLPDETLVYPAHDYKGMRVSTIWEEKKYNPRLGGGKSKPAFIEIMNNLNLAKPKRIDVSVPANMKCGKID
ncbi:MAG: MBL fold metallo-hydrolase [bacterium]